MTKRQGDTKEIDSVGVKRVWDGSEMNARKLGLNIGKLFLLTLVTAACQRVKSCQEVQ